MRPETFGRALGIGARLLGRRVFPPDDPRQTAAPAPRPDPHRARQGEALGRAVRRVPQGSRNFGRAVWNPFAKAGRTLWLEITGAFFLLFAVLFAQHLWTIRAAWRSGPEQAHFWVYAGLSVMFAWFAFTSFARSRKP